MLLFLWLAYEDAKYQHVSLGGLFLFDLLGGSYFFINQFSLPLYVIIVVWSFILLMCYLGYQEKLGFGDVLAAIGCFFFAPQTFFLMMSGAFIFCTVSLLIRKKRRIGFLPYMWSSFIIIYLWGVVLC